MSDRLLALASAQHGVLSSKDAARVDVVPNGLSALVRARVLVHVRRDAYVLSSEWDPATPERRLALRARAIVHARGQGVLTHQSALAAHGLPLHGVPLDVVDATGPVRRVRIRASLRLHPGDPDMEVRKVDGCRVVPVEVALAQVALRHGRDAAVIPADAALRRGLTTLNDTIRVAHLLAGTPRSATRAERWLSFADALSESPGETRTRLVLTDLGHQVRSQVRIADARGVVVARVDLLVGDRVVVEFDGLVKYEGADGRAALAAEKRREDMLRSLGYEVVRVTWADVERRRRIDTLVRQALDRLARRRAG